MTQAPVLTVVDADVPDEALSVDALGSRIVGLAGRMAAATCRWLLLVAEFDAREGCARFGLPSTARWLSHHCGIAHRTAVEHVRVARALADFPALATEMSAGRLSYTQVRAISRVPTDRTEQRVVSDLIELARYGSATQLETMVRGLRTVEDNERAAYDPPETYVRHGWTSRSHWQLNARLAPEDGTVVQTAIDTVARAEGLTRPEALLRMAEIALAAINDRDDPPRPLRGDERAAVVVHLDAAAVERAATSGEPRSAERARPHARIDRGPGLSDSVVRRLLCAGRIRTVVQGARGNVRDLGRSHRVVTERQFRALLLRDGCCAHPGCESTAGLQAHHVVHWIDGGRTDLTNLLLLCARHHHAHHDGEFRIETGADGRFRFFRADGRELLQYVDPAAWAGTDRPLESEYDGLAPAAATSRWCGDRMDRAFAVSVFAERRYRERARAG